MQNNYDYDIYRHKPQHLRQTIILSLDLLFRRKKNVDFGTGSNTKTNTHINFDDSYNIIIIYDHG